MRKFGPPAPRQPRADFPSSCVLNRAHDERSVGKLISRDILKPWRSGANYDVRNCGEERHAKIELSVRAAEGS